MNGKSYAVAAGLGVALVAVVVCLVLLLSYRSQVNADRTQIGQVTQELSSLRSAEQQAEKTATQANNARLGVCWSTTQDTNTFDLSQVQLASPVISGGVYQCPSGMQFVSVVPAAG